MPCITEFYYHLYPNKVKEIPLNIYELLTPVALAHLIMGDGQTSCHGLVLSTNSYSIQDVVRLMNVLMIIYRLKCNIRKFWLNKNSKYLIYIRHGYMPLLRTIVKPYMHSSMLYQLENYKVYYTTSAVTKKSSFSIKVSKKVCSTSVYVKPEILNKILYSTINIESELNPYWVTGFCDAESSFIIKVSKKST